MFSDITYTLDDFQPFRAEDGSPPNVFVYGEATITYDRNGDWLVMRVDVDAGRERSITISQDTGLFKAIVAELEGHHRDAIAGAVAADLKAHSQPDPDEKYERMRDARIEEAP